MSTFKRNQVEWAIGRTLGLEEDRSRAPRKDLVLKLKRLMDMDRRTPVRTELQESTTAFLPAEKASKGTDYAFEAADAFCLLVGYLLLMSGMPQGRVVHLMRKGRRELADEFGRLLVPGEVVEGGQPVVGDRPPASPTSLEEMTYFILHTGIGSDLYYHRQADTGDLKLANICRSSTEIAKLMQYYGSVGLPVTAIEISGPARQLQYWLEHAPIIKRGRG